MQAAVETERLQFAAHALKHGDPVVLGNRPARKVGGLRAPIEAAGGRLLHRPADSFGFNLIGLVFAPLKASLRAEATRTVSASSDTIRRPSSGASPRPSAATFPRPQAPTLTIRSDPMKR
ncbi:hypothetical protein [Methylobacterium fujisawaense]